MYAHAPTEGLTRREQEVVALLARDTRVIWGHR
jgi:hypothetical protein